GVDDRGGQPFLVAERAVERGPRAAGLPDDVAERGAPVALFDEGIRCGVEEAFGAQFTAPAKLHVRARPERSLRPPGGRRGWRDGLGHGACVAAWNGCGRRCGGRRAANRATRGTMGQVVALSVRSVLSVRRNHSPDCGWNFEQVSIGAL